MHKPSIGAPIRRFRRIGPPSFIKGVGIHAFRPAISILRRLAGLAVGSGSSDQSKEAEILVLRHQLEVLHRQVGRPRLGRRDRVLLATLSRALLRPSLSSFAVSPQTLLRWHQELVARKWTTAEGHPEGDHRWAKTSAS